jgi:hypothetical protein
MLPNRIPTGVKNQTVPNPAKLWDGMGDSRVFEGLASDYDFEKQTENFERLSAVLAANGTYFTKVAAAHYDGNEHTNHRFNVLTENGALMWHKYVGMAAQSGQNHVFVAGMRIKVSIFLAMDEKEQRILLSGDKVLVTLVMEPDRLKYINEAGTLWC